MVRPKAFPDKSGLISACRQDDRTGSPGARRRGIPCIERPEVARTYKAFFGDIYQLDARLMPMFDVFTAFHLGEFRIEKNDAYGGLTDLEVASLMVDHLNPGGRLIIYSGSYAYDVAERDVGKLVTAGRLAFVERFETLMVFRKTA